MYESFFHLREKPFDIVPDPAYLFRSRTHRQSMNYVRYGLQERLGYVLMTGEVGSGKTMVVRELVRTMGREFTFSRVFNTRLNSQELLAMANEDFGLDTAGKGKVQLLKDLYGFLIEENEAGRKPVLIIDEAQNLSLDLLEEVRMLSNFETSYTKLLQIVLVGQPELGRVLSLPEMRQFRQRIGISCRILPLTRQETEEYIRHRLDVAGNTDAVSFTDEAWESIHWYTGGIPRQINTLCNFLLLTAYTEERRDINGKMVRDVAQGIGLSSPEAPDAHGGSPDKQASGEPGKGSATGRRVLLKALGADLRDDGLSSDAERHPGAADADGEYPPTIRTIGSRLHAMDKERNILGNEGSAVYRQRIDSPGNSRTDTGRRQGGTEGWGKTPAGTKPREDENADDDRI